MDTNTLFPKVAAAAFSLTATYAGNRNLGTDPKRLAVIKVWDSMMGGARTSVRVTSTCKTTDLTNHENVI